MTREEFRRLADAWGGDVERWPEHVRVAARQLAASADGLDILNEARRLDRVLAIAPPVSADRAALASFAVLQRLAAPGDREPWYRSLWSSRWLVPAASLACSALVGASLAAALPYERSRDQQDGALVLGMILDSGSMATTWVLR